MSHYCEIETEFRDLECLVKALNDIGITDIRHHKNAQQLQGFAGDLRQQRANVIVPKEEVNRKLSGGASNDLGFLWEGKKYKAVVSEFDKRNWWNRERGKLTQRYNYHKITKEAKRHGRRVREARLDDGTVKLTITA